MTSRLFGTSSRILKRTSYFGHLSRGLRLDVPKFMMNSNLSLSKSNESSGKDNHSSDLLVEYIRGTPHLTIPLASRNELCRFAFRPLLDTVGDLIQMLKTEDAGIDRVAVTNNNGIRISSACNIEDLMDAPFWIQLNEEKYHIFPPKRHNPPNEASKKLYEMKVVVEHLYETLQVGDFLVKKEQDLLKRLAELEEKTEPFERQFAILDAKAKRKGDLLEWAGLIYLSLQVGFFARLTWWEYSWDIIEPVTYFTSYALLMGFYAYYYVTKREYTFKTLQDRLYLNLFYKRAKKDKIDISEYNRLKRQIAEIKYDLRRLRDPLNLQLPRRINKSK